MPPSRPRHQPDDSRSEASSTKEKGHSNPSGVSSSKNRRVANNTIANTTSALRDVAMAEYGAGSDPSTAGSDSNPSVSFLQHLVSSCGQSPIHLFPSQIQWSSFDPSILHGYRYDYRLNTAATFKKPYNQHVLSTSHIGRMSPTMARKKDQRRQDKDSLANAVRRHFNSMGIAENEVVVDFLYKVRWQGESRLWISSRIPHTCF